MQGLDAHAGVAEPTCQAVDADLGAGEDDRLLGPLGLVLNGVLTAFGYDPLGLDNNLPAAAGKINATLLQDDAITKDDGLAFYPDWPVPGYYDVLVAGGQSLINGSKSPDQVLADLVRFGAPPQIAVEARPHVGSNLLPKVLTALLDAGRARTVASVITPSNTMRSWRPRHASGTLNSRRYSPRSFGMISPSQYPSARWVSPLGAAIAIVA